MFRKLPGFKSLARKSRRRPANSPHVGLAMESLEDRVLLAGFGQELEQDLILQQGPLDSLLAAGSKVPLVGNRLANNPAAAALRVFADQKLTGISEKYDSLSAANKNNATAVGNALFEILGPSGTGLIPNRSDLLVAINANASTISVTMRFNKSLPNITLGGGFGLGLAGLPFSVTASGGVNVSEVKFTQTAVFNFKGNNITGDGAVTGPLNFSAKANLIPGSTIQAKIGFLKSTLTDTGTFATVQFNSQSGVKFDAHVKLFADATFADDTQFPSLSANFVLDWNTFGNVNALPQGVRFDNVSVSLGQFVSNLLRPIVEKVQLVTQPIQPIIDFLKTPVPGVSDLAEVAGLGTITVQDIIKLYGASQVQSAEMSKQIDMYLTVAGIIDQINGINPDASLKINVGSLDLTADPNLLIAGGKLSETLAGFERNWEQALDESLGDAGSQIKDLLNGAEENIRLTFPLIQNPLKGAFKLFVGQHADLVILDLKYADGSTAPSKSGSIYGIAFGFNGGMKIDSSLRLGYDTYGFSKFLASGGNAAHLADGFYLDDSTHFTLSGDIGVFAGGGIVVFSVSISGGLTIPTDNPLNVTLNMGDPNIQPDRDFTKLHFDEIDADCLFNTSGRLDAGVQVTVTVGVEIPNPFGNDIFVGYTKDFEIASVNIFDLGPAGGHTCQGFGGGGDGLRLAALDSNGNLTLAMGPNVGLLRGPTAPTNGNEDFFVESVIEIDPFFGDISKLWVHAYGMAQSFPLTGQFKVETIYADGGSGDDSIIIDKSVQDINVVVHGGAGNDRLEHYGSGIVVEMYGDGGNDLLLGGTGIEKMFGDAGNDVLIGGGGNDVLAGFEGNDKLFGGTGDDLMDGGVGDDEIDAGGGRDQAGGGDGADIFTVYPGIGSPVLLGGNSFAFDNNINDKLIVSGSIRNDSTQVVKSGEGVQIFQTNGQLGRVDSLVAIGFEHIFIEPGIGADLVRIDDLSGTVVKNVVVNQREYLNSDKAADIITVNATAISDTAYVNQLVSLIREGTGPVPPKGVKYRPDEFGTAQQVTFLDKAGTFEQTEKYHVWTPNSAGDTLIVNTLGGRDLVRLSSDAQQITGPTGYVEVDGGADADTVFVRSVTSATDIRGGTGDDIVVVGELGVVDPIRKSVFLEGGDGFDTLIFADNLSNSAKTGELSTTGNTGGIIGFGMGGWVIFGTTEIVDMRLGSGDDRLTIRGTPANAATRTILVDTGAGADTVNVHRTSTAVTLNGKQGLDTVNIGLNGSTQGIGGPLTVINPGGYTAVNINDSADTIARTVIVYNNGFSNGSFTVISGLTPGGDIVLRGRQLRSLSILAGTPASGAGNTFRIHYTPVSNTPGGLTTTISSGGGPDQVAVNGALGALALNAQAGGNLITVGSATTGLDNIFAPINVSGLGLSNTLYVIDGASTISHDYVIARDFVQRLDKARISFQNLNSLNLQAGAQTDYMTVQDTMPPVGFNSSTTIAMSGGDDRTDVSRTTGRLNINAGGFSEIKIGNAQNSLANIQGAIAVSPSGANNYVTLTLNDQAATTPQQLDVTPSVFGPLFRRTGAADINVLFNPLGVFEWVGGSGGNTVNVKAQPAWNVAYFTMGDGGDVVDIGTANDTLFDINGLVVIGGAGPDQLLMRDQGTTTPRVYDVRKGKFVGQESRGSVGASSLNGLTNASINFEHVDTVTLNGGSGGNLFKIAGTPLATSLRINTGTGADTVDAGNQAYFAAFNSLRNLLGSLTLDGQAGVDQVTFNDQGTVTDENYTLYPGVISTTFASPDYHYSGIEFLTINGSAGVNNFGFSYDPGAADPLITLNGGDGSNLLAGPHVPNLWQITGANSGLLNTNVTFASMQSFYGGADDDAFVISAGASVDGSINGLGGVNTLDYSAYAGAASTLARAAQLDRDLGLYATDNLFENFYGHGERWVKDPSLQWYFILPDGRVYRDGAGAAALPAANLVATLDPSFHQDIVKLVNAQHINAGGLEQDPFGSLAAQLDRDLNLNATDNLYYNYGGLNERWIVSGTYPTAFQWYFILPSGELYLWDGTANAATGQLVATLDASFHDDISKLVDAQYLFNRDSSASLVARYSGEQNFNDAVGGNNGTQVGGVGFDPGKIGYAFSFDDNYVTVPNAPSLEPTTVSVEAWVNSWFTQPSNVYVLAKGANGDLRSSYALHTGAHSGLVFSVYDGDYTNVESPEAGVGIWDGNWHHVVGTYDGASVRLYVDGAEVGGGTPTNIAIAYGLQDTEDPSLGTDDLFIGTHPLIAGGANFVGGVDELSVYSRALSSAEIQAIYVGDPPTQSTGVVVNLQLGTASALTGGIANIQNVIGSAGNDILVGNGGNVLSGGAGRDLLISGAFSSVLNGGDQDDILIGGTTNYDTDRIALNAIMAEWSSAADYATRVANLMNGANGAPILNATTVFSNGGGNTLSGNAGLDLFFANMDDLDTLYGDPLTEEFVAV